MLNFYSGIVKWQYMPVKREIQCHAGKQLQRKFGNLCDKISERVQRKGSQTVIMPQSTNQITSCNMTDSVLLQHDRYLVHSGNMTDSPLLQHDGE